MVTRGFVGRRQPPETGARLPPGQYLTDDFPILQIGPNPTVDLATWTFTLRAGSRPIKAWSWAEFEPLRVEQASTDRGELSDAERCGGF
ncbi:hypothetical protein [Methylobacterium sp. B1]|uniref:hypothetical protein n=1 Tax=Methylobacterium sp. B1 TaxID=91459 RepID=UPI00034B60CC